MKKTTEELINEIEKGSTVEAYLEENAGQMRMLSLSEYLQEMLEKYGIKKADLFRRAGLVGNNYGYELFQNDRKSPSRDILLKLCVAFPLTIEETQYALRCGNLAVLYPRNMRDAYILFALKNKMSVDVLNELLVEKKQDTLG